MTLYGYIRVSTQDQALNGLSISAQTSLLLKEGVLEGDVFVDDGRSGGLKDYDYFERDNHYIIDIDLNSRPAFCKLVFRTIKSGDTIVFSKWDRLSRSIIFLEFFVNLCKKKGVLLKPVDDSNDEIIRQIMSVLGQNELSKTKLRIEAIQRDLFLKGVHPFRCFFGYKKKEGQRFVIVEKEAEVVRRVFALKNEGKLVSVIGEELGVHVQTVMNIIKNEYFYRGFIRFKSEERKGNHPPII